jgi:hypothetical protein
VECHILNSGTNLRECEDQSWFKVQAVPVFRFDGCMMLEPQTLKTPWTSSAYYRDSFTFYLEDSENPVFHYPVREAIRA